MPVCIFYSILNRLLYNIGVDFEKVMEWSRSLQSSLLVPDIAANVRTITTKCDLPYD